MENNTNKGKQQKYINKTTYKGQTVNVKENMKDNTYTRQIIDIQEIIKNK